VTCPDKFSTGLRLAFLFLPYTNLCIYIDFSCHVVFFSRRFLPRFWHFLLISSHPMIFIVSFVILFVSILASFCVWTKSLMCKGAVNRDSTCQSIFRRLCTIEEFRFPVNRPDEVSSRPDAHLSTVPSVRTTCHPVRTPDRPVSSVRTTCHSVRTLHCIEKLLFQLASVRTSQ